MLHVCNVSVCLSSSHSQASCISVYLSSNHCNASCISLCLSSNHSNASCISVCLSSNHSNASCIYVCLSSNTSHVGYFILPHSSTYMYLSNLLHVTEFKLLACIQYSIWKYNSVDPDQLASKKPADLDLHY